MAMSRVLAIVALFAVVFTAAASAGDDHRVGLIPVGRAASCRGTIAECMGGNEFELESESARRILATSGYISYDALKRDTVPCSQRGNSYYNCKPGATGNPYTRGCSAITRCRS